MRHLIKTCQVRLMWLLLILLSSCSLAETARQTEEFNIYRGEAPLVSYVVEMATTERARKRGLMFRREMPDTQGMLLKYPREMKMAIWMKNTLIPLDILFVDESGRIVKIHENAEPLSTRSIYSGQEVRAVLEVNAGQVRKHGIRVGDTLQVATGSPR